jgi:hypothetical protein
MQVWLVSMVSDSQHLIFNLHLRGSSEIAERAVQLQALSPLCIVHVSSAPFGVDDFAGEHALQLTMCLHPMPGALPMPATVKL